MNVVRLRAIVDGFSAELDPFKLDIRHVGDWKGFELWKGNESPHSNIYVRYIDFGKPMLVADDETVVGAFLRMQFFKTPFTSVQAFKSFCNECLRD